MSGNRAQPGNISGKVVDMEVACGQEENITRIEPGLQK